MNTSDNIMELLAKYLQAPDHLQIFYTPNEITELLEILNDIQDSCECLDQYLA